jgi:RND family efflux transporter MFP subunit
MTAIQFLVEWALRSSILILSGALLLLMFRVKDPSIRLAAWTVMLFSSLAIPALTAALPKVPLIMLRVAARPAETPVVLHEATRAPVPTASGRDNRATTNAAGDSRHFNWAGAALVMYILVALALLLRLCVGLAMSLRLRRCSRATDQATEGIEIRESDSVAAPVTLGIVHPAIMLPADWRQWDAAKLDAVLAHERSHIRRHDPAVQLLSAIHRALLWHSPLSWFLHKRIVRAAEEASDDAAVAVMRDRALYAEVLLGFIQRGVRRAGWLGVPMARYGRADKRIHRILDATVLSHGITRWSLATILALISPIAYVVAVAHPQSAAQVPPTTSATPVPVALPAPRTVAQHAVAAQLKPGPAGLQSLGYVAAYTVIVKPRVDGQLLSVNFKEGDQVQEGQLLATIDPRAYQPQVAQAEGQLARDQAELADFKLYYKGSPQTKDFELRVAQFEGSIKIDQAKVDDANRQLSYTQILSPIRGIAGLRQVDPGNIVHSGDPNGIVIINQLQPIAVVFTLFEDSLPQVLARFRQEASMPVEAWNRAATVRIATGRLTGVDNQIDQATGTVKLKAMFDNKDGALFPNQFVNVRLLVNTR